MDVLTIFSSYLLPKSIHSSNYYRRCKTNVRVLREFRFEISFYESKVPKFSFLIIFGLKQSLRKYFKRTVPNFGRKQRKYFKFQVCSELNDNDMVEFIAIAYRVSYVDDTIQSTRSSSFNSEHIVRNMVLKFLNNWSSC